MSEPTDSGCLLDLQHAPKVDLIHPIYTRICKRIRDASIYTSKNIAQAFILERYFFVSIYPAVIPGTYLMVFLVVALLLCLLHRIYIQRS